MISLEWVSAISGMRSMKVSAAQQTREWLVGARLGSALRKAQSIRKDAAVIIGRKGPRPQIRRAHWHTCRTDPRTCDGQRIPNTKQQAHLKWLHPTLVRVSDSNQLTSVVYPIS